MAVVYRTAGQLCFPSNPEIDRKAIRHTPVVLHIAGEVEGNVVASAQVKLLESGQLIGDLKATTLTVAAGSRMRGHVEFGWSEAQAAKFVNGRAHENAKNGTNQ